MWPRPPRKWQADAFGEYISCLKSNYLAAVCPGAGKTAFALAVAKYLLQEGLITKVVVVSPTEPLTRQWCDKAAEFGIALDPDSRSTAPFDHPRQYVGVSITYQALPGAGVAAAFCRALNLSHTLVILDEVHHTGETKAWGSAVLSAFELARFRLLLTGTPKRSDTAKIAFADYQSASDGREVIRRDFTYGTGRGVRDFVIRRTDCRFYDGEVNEVPYGQEVAYSRSLSEALKRDDVSELLQAVMNPDSGWLYELMKSVDREVSGIRRTVPNAGCLILADDQAKAKAYVDVVKRTTGHMPTVVISDDADAKDKLERFAAGDDPYLIAVRMVSEGVDIPRLRVLVYLTRTKTELFFAQATARVVRIGNPQDTNPAVIFMPALPVLRELAQGIEDEVVHEIDLLEQEQAQRTGQPPPDVTRAAAKAAALPDERFPRTLPDDLDTRGVSGAGTEPGDQMCLLPPAVSVDNIVLHTTLLGSNAHDVDLHHAAQSVIDNYGYPQTLVGIVRQFMHDGLLPTGQAAPTSPLDAPPPSTAPEPVQAEYKIRSHLRRELENLTRRIACAYFDGNNDDRAFNRVRSQVNQETGAYAQYGNNEQLRAGIAYAKEWLRRLAQGGAA